jgi:hypothetical protein
MNTSAATINGMNGQIPTDMQAYENDYLFDLLGYRVLEQAISPDQLQRINDWVDAQPPRQPGDWVGNIHVHSYQGHDGTNYQNIIEAGDVFEEMMDNAPWYDAARRYIVNDFNGLSIQENFLNVREQGGFIGIHSGGHIPAAIFTTRHHTGAWNVGQINVLMASHLTSALATVPLLLYPAATRATWFIPRWLAATSKPTATICRQRRA